MVTKICSCKEIKDKNQDQGLDVFEGGSFTDFYVIGKIWIDALRICLIGSDLNIFPVVEAARAEAEPPKRPPPMKLSELPIYRSAHNDYKDYLEDRENSDQAKVKLIHRSLQPRVADIRERIKRRCCDIYCFVKGNLNSAVASVRGSKDSFKQTMRDPDNLQVRQAVVASGGVVGYMLGGGSGVTRRLFFTSAGLLTTGALCFPKETDEIFRNTTYVIGKSLIAVYNKWCGKDFNPRERLACRDELPEEPPQRTPIKCPPPQ